MEATITIEAGANSRTLDITAANQVRILAAIERSGFPRDPDNTGTDLNDFEYFTQWLIAQYRNLVLRSERAQAERGVVDDEGLIG